MKRKPRGNFSDYALKKREKRTKNFSIFAIMGSLFLVIEVCFRVIDYPVPSGPIDMTVMSPFAFVGYTSLWMFIVGGLSGLLIGLINENHTISKIPYFLQVMLGAFIITALELVSGLVLNVWLGFRLWDYSFLPLDFMGQISLVISLVWLLMTPLAMWIDDVLRYYLAGKEKPEGLVFYYLDIFKSGNN
jgi:hypothetical protein